MRENSTNKMEYDKLYSEVRDTEMEEWFNSISDEEFEQLLVQSNFDFWNSIPATEHDDGSPEDEIRS